MNLSGNDLTQIAHIEFRNPGAAKRRAFTGVSTDTRTLQPGNLFVALRGEHFDGHRYLAEAFARGARAAVVEARAETAAVATRPLLVVENSVRALGMLARLYRDRFNIPVIAVGGSNGKTTTKDMIAAVLSTTHTVLSTGGNHNNDIGVPLTLFRLQKKHEVAVVEIGTNHPGELAWLCQVLDPTHGVVTAIGREHLEFFGSLEGVAREEGELYEVLRNRKKGMAFVRADDPAVSSLATGIRRRVTYGFAARRADIRGKDLKLNAEGCAEFLLSLPRSKKPLEIRLGIPGEHSAVNALAAAAVGSAFRVPAKAICGALESIRPSSRRMEVVHLEGVLIFNDTYNANPDSMLAALKTLAATRVRGKRIAVLADMRELGAAGPAEHERVGRAARELRIDYVLTFGPLARRIHESAGTAQALHYDEKNMLAEYLAELIAPGDAVLVKGSRGMKMEDVVAFLVERLRTAVVPFG
jgi:UDP-N-acetylmuramoyl-tripeptide--D-alanyl-D-alanine ligase